MSFSQGLSGLNAASSQLSTIGNNVANANTVGFKGSTAQFADVFAASMNGGGSSTQIGIGVQLQAVAQSFSQGNITATNSSLDLAINGGGFFILSNAQGTSYSRNGQFELNNSGQIVNAAGNNLQGYQITNGIPSGSPTNLTVPTSVANAQATGTSTTTGVIPGVSVSMNLNSNDTAPATVPFNPIDPTSFNNSTSTTTYDSKGDAQTTTMYFVKTAVANTWNVYSTVQVPSTGAYLYNPGTSDGTLTFTTGGTLKTWAPTVATGISFTPVGANVENIPYTFTGSTQFGTSFGVNSISQDGYTAGQLSGFSIGTDGTITGKYSNGQSKALGQVALATFPSDTGLQQIGGNAWTQTAASGAPVVGAPGTGNNGVLQTSATEDSNVDLTTELVNMITAQRYYQANAQTIKTQDTVTQTLINLR